MVCFPVENPNEKYFPDFVFDSSYCPSDGCVRQYCIGEYGKHIHEEIYDSGLSVRSVVKSTTDGSSPTYALNVQDLQGVLRKPASVEWHTFFYGNDYYTVLANDILEDISIWGNGIFKDLSNTEPVNQFFCT